ncbi:hypothetical protein HY449_04615 [Candidatus Pacearchaeota archaeon]|nr:hypothetical protein [Candidatus Pacearchaeota archaeon]
MLQTIGFGVLEERDKKDFEKLFNEYSVKIQRKLKNISSSAIHLKEYEKDGLRKKFSVHARIVAPTIIFEADAANWDFKRTLHKVFNKLEQEIEHKFHVSDEHKR